MQHGKEMSQSLRCERMNRVHIARNNVFIHTGFIAGPVSCLLDIVSVLSGAKPTEREAGHFSICGGGLYIMRVPAAFFRILFCSLFTRHLHMAVYSELLKASSLL